MKHYLAIALLILTVPCATAGAQTKSDQPRAGTVIEPAPEKIQLTPELIQSAQAKLNEEGYKSGTVDGKMGPATRGAILKYQQDKGLKVTGTLDQSTLTHLNVGAGKVMATAPGDIGRGAKAAGHNIKEGHPVAAGEALGKGVGRAGKAVGEGTKSAVVGSEHKDAGKKPDESTSQPPN